MSAFTAKSSFLNNSFKRLRSYLCKLWPKSGNDRVGRWGERMVLREITSSGLIPVATNWRDRFGEIDIIALDKRCLVTIEVKTRHESLKGAYPALSAIDYKKRERLQSLARSFIRNNGPFCRRYAITSQRTDGVEVYYYRSKIGALRPSGIYWHRNIGH
jgi:putative endonuclease